jgi:hypothetical protein
MNDDLKRLYSTKSGGELDANDCVRINTALSKINIGEIPKDQIENVRDYLIASLNTQSVETGLIVNLEKLLELLQQTITQQPG